VCRRAFTLIELLVVIAIVGVLVALLLPAVQAVREAARRVQCANNLKQIGLALHVYHEAIGTFPPGYLSKPGLDGGNDGPGWGWASMILPGLEQAPVFDAVNFGLAIESPSNQTARRTTIDVFACPSDASFQPWFTVVDYTASATEPGRPLCDVGATNYVGSFGLGDPMDIPGRDLGEGLFFRNRPVGLRDVLDGTGQTLAVGERSHNLSRPTWTGAVTRSSVPVLELQASPGIDPSGGAALVLAYPGASPGLNVRPAYADYYWSRHPGGAQFLRADGGARFINAQIRLTVLRALTTRDGGEILSIDSYGE
jgi:prepilin-type N-terminal cleavage/methylation domain-containing protein